MKPVFISTHREAVSISNSRMEYCLYLLNVGGWKKWPQKHARRLQINPFFIIRSFKLIIDIVILQI